MGSCVAVCSSSCSARCAYHCCCCCCWCQNGKVGPLNGGSSLPRGTSALTGAPGVKGVRSRSFKAVGTMSLAAIRFQKSQAAVPLSEREVFTIVRSWKGVRRQIAEAGADMFIRMFQTSPLVKTVFEKFRSIDGPDDLRSSTTLRTHGLVVMSAIDEIITNLDDEESVLELGYEQGRTHARFDELPEALLWEIETPFLNAVEEALGPKHYTPHLARLYKKTIKYILTLLSVGFQEARAEMTQVEMTNNMAASVISLHSGTMQSTTAGLATPDNAGGRK